MGVGSKEILTKVDSLEAKVTRIEADVKTLQTDVNELKELKDIVLGMREEHGALLRAILENKEVQRGEIDVLQHRTAKIEGTVKGAAKQILADLKDVSNR